MAHRKRHDKRRPLPRFALGRDDALVAIHDTTTNRQTDTRTFVFVFAMKPLKDLKNPCIMGWFKANTVI